MTEIRDADGIRAASVRLPERQREALMLHEQEQRSYEEIAAIMGTNRDPVAQLISRARINLYDDLWGTALASIATPSPECERALPLLAARQDGELEASPADAAWLDSHLAECERCRLGEEQMREAAAAYSSMMPLVDAGAAAAPAGEPSDASAPSQEAMARSAGSPAPAGGSSRRRVTVALSSVAVLLLLSGLAVAFRSGDQPAPVRPAARTTAGQHAGGAGPGAKSTKPRTDKTGAAKRNRSAGGAPNASAAIGEAPATMAGEAMPTLPPPSGPSGSGGQGGDAKAAPDGADPKGAPGQTGVEPTRQTAGTKPSSKSKPAPTSTATSQATTAPAPSPAPPPAQEPPDGPGRSEEAPGKPADRPPR